jgi:glyoxylase-like metal-dependent hydrolase (beta-lactamase superfamily II)
MHRLCHLIAAGQAAFVNPKMNHAVSILLDALKQQELGPQNVEYIAITHTHLDHTGGRDTRGEVENRRRGTVRASEHWKT